MNKTIKCYCTTHSAGPCLGCEGEYYCDGECGNIYSECTCDADNN